MLVAAVARRLAADRTAGIYAGVVFASSFAVADAVLWSSSRVDLLSTCFALCSLLLFSIYLETPRRRLLAGSVSLFILALCAKGTPVVLPLVLVWLAWRPRGPAGAVRISVPYAAVVVVYFCLLGLRMPHATTPLTTLRFSLHNAALALGDLAVPERLLAGMAPAAVAVVVAGLLPKGSAPLCRLRRTGLVLVGAALLPVLILQDFRIVAGNEDASLLLTSPSHRIYLAAAGLALLAGGFLRAGEAALQRLIPRAASRAVVLLLVCLAVGSAREVALRDRMWQEEGDLTRQAFEGVMAYRPQIVDGAQIALVNFPGAQGFADPMYKMFFVRGDVTVLMTRGLVGPRDEVRVLEKAAVSYLFVLGSDGQVYDLTDLFRRKMYHNIQALAGDHPEQQFREGERVAAILNQRIAELIR